MKIISTVLFITLITACSSLQKRQDLHSNGLQRSTLEYNDPGTVYTFFRDFSGTLVAVVGLVIGIPILRRKLLSNHVTKALSDIQESNRQLSLSASKLKEELIPKTFGSEKIQIEELKELSDKINSLYTLSSGAISESQTVLYYLKFTLQHTLKNYLTDKVNWEYLDNRQLYFLVIRVLDDVLFYSTQLVSVPKSTKLISESILTKKLRKYVNNPTHRTYRHLKLGYNNDPHSLLYFVYLYDLRNCSHTLLKRSGFKIHENKTSILPLLYHDQIYAPLELVAPCQSPIKKQHELYLIGFNIYSYSATGKKDVELYYTNPSDFSLFLKSMLDNNRIEGFMDSYSESTFEFDKAYIPYEYRHFETMKIQFDYDYLHELFLKNKVQIKKQLKAKKKIK